MAVEVRLCAICTLIIEQDAPITICPGCGTLYHDRCYRSSADCRHAECTARPSVADPASEPSRDPAQGLTEAAPSLERKATTLERSGLPNRVKSGEFTSQGMALETAAGRTEVRWSSIELITLGIIEESVGDQPHQKSGLRSMMRKLFFGEGDNDHQRVRKVRDVFLLDVFVRDQAQPYRIDGTTVNYRSFLGEVSYASSQNFSRLVSRIVQDSSECRVDGSTVSFLTGQRDKVKRFSGVYDFELEAWQNRDRMEKLTPRGDLRLGAVATPSGVLAVGQSETPSGAGDPSSERPRETE